MQTQSIGGISLYFEPREGDAAKLIGDSIRESIALIQAQWQLETPDDCRAYVMTSWQQFTFHPAPLRYRLSLVLLFPIYYWRVRRIWDLAAGLSISYGKRQVMGVKPPRMMATSDRTIGQRIFEEGMSETDKVRHIVCHELTHAFTAHLKLPMWLNEGMAMLTADLLMGKPIVKQETIKALDRSPQRSSPGSYRRVSYRDEDAVVYHTVRGYWIARYIHETQPDLLRELLSQRQKRRQLENSVADAYGLTRQTFWQTIDNTLVSYFGSD